MPVMFYRKISHILLIPILIAALCGGCKRAPAPTTSSTPPGNTATPESAQSHAIETETVGLSPIAGVIPATGKILVTENRMANIGPVHEGRIVRLYAGQGTSVRKGQQLADLQSADIDQA